jgi:hypothetical protein
MSLSNADVVSHTVCLLLLLLPLSAPAICLNASLQQSCCCPCCQCFAAASAAAAAESAHLITKATVADADVLQLLVLLQHGTQLGSCLTADGMAAADEFSQDSVVLQGAAELSNILQVAASAQSDRTEV